MSFSIGIVGLPNVGKSTLFNALTKSKQANVQNYPFCTIDPNVGVVEVPDERLKKLAEVSVSKKIIPTTIEFVDIAGLVRGASEGEGLGNKFLSHIREVDAIAQVVRNFTDNNITHVHNRVDPVEDASIINTELALADIQTVYKRLENVKKSAKGLAAKDAEEEIVCLEKVFAHLQKSEPVRTMEFTEDEKIFLKDLHLLTMKPMLYIVNSDELPKDATQLQNLDAHTTVIQMCAKLEAELAELSPEDAKEYAASLGISESGLDKLVTAGYKILNLITYFTSGEQETRAWTVGAGTKAPDAAGVIHTDFVKGFVKADVVSWKDFVEVGGWSKLRESGKMRLEGKDYIIKDGDTCYFHVAT